MRSSLNVLVIDDEPGHAEATAEALERVGFHCDLATSGRDGLARIKNDNVDIVITDLAMDDVDGMAILEAAKAHAGDIEVIMITGHGSERIAVQAMQKGAYHYLAKPFDMDELRTVIQKAAEKQQLVRHNVELRRQLDKRFGLSGIIGNAAAMQRIFDTLQQVAMTHATVLIQGESGTGKELLARAIHQNGRRKDRLFVGLNCAALSEGILESELFGHEKGAFTGADRQRQGRFEYANGGTLFLDEIGDMPLSTQIKLLRVIEEREILRVGSNEPIKVDVRLIAATNQDIEELVRLKRFREDLYFRLNVVRVSLPPLRERREDIPLLIDAFIREFAETHSKQIAGIEPDAHRALCRHDWPGNVRELKNSIESMVVMSRGERLTLRDLPDAVLSATEGLEDARHAPASGLHVTPGTSLEAMEKELIRRTLETVGGNREEAAKQLKIGERTLYRKLDRYGLR